MYSILRNRSFALLTTTTWRLRRGVRWSRCAAAEVASGRGATATETMESFLETIRSAETIGDLTVYLGSSLLKVAIVPPVKNVKSSADLQRIGLAHMRGRFGLAPDEWIVRCDSPTRSGRRLISAAPLPTIATLEGIFKSSKSRVVSIAPFFPKVINCVGDEIKPVVAVVEPDAVMCLLVNGEEFEAIQIYPTGPNDHKDVSDALDRFLVSRGLTGSRDLTVVRVLDVPSEDAISCTDSGSAADKAVARNDFVDLIA